MFGQIKRNSAERHRIKADRYIEEKEYNLAIEELRKVLNISPNSDRILYAIGWCYNKLNSPENAVKYCRDAINLNPAIAEYHSLLGECLFPQGKSNEAIYHLSRAIDLNPDANPFYYSQRGYYLGKLGRYQDAIDDYTEAISLDSGHYWMYSERASFFYHLPDYESAAGDLAQAIALCPNSDELAELYYRRAHCFINLERYNEAILDITEAIEYNPQMSEYYGMRAECWYQLGKYDDALRNITRALSLDPFNEKYICSKGRYLYMHGDYEEALAEFRFISSSDSSILYNIGRCLCNLGHYDEAVVIFGRSIALTDDDSLLGYIYIWRGDCFINLERYDEAIKDYTRSIELNINESHSYYQRSYCLSCLGRYDEALDDSTRAIELEFSDDSLIDLGSLLADHCQRGHCLEGLERYDEAIEEYTYAITITDVPNDEYYYYRGFVLHKLRRFEDALADCKQAIGINPKKMLHYVNAAITLRDLKRYRESINILTEALALDTENRKHLDEIYRERGIAHLMLGNYDNALSDMEEALRLNPDDALLLYYKGRCLYKSADYNRCIELCTQSILNDSGPKSYELRGKCFYQLEQYEDALADFISARNYGESVEVNGYVADCLEKLGQYDEALMLYRANLHSEPDEPEHYFKVGYIYFKQQCFEIALSHLNEGLRLNDSDVDMWYYKGQCHLKIQQYEEALSATQKCIKLNLHSDPDVLYPLENTAHKIRELIQSEKKWANISHVTFMGNHNPINIGGIQATDNASIQRSVIERELNDVSDTLLKYINKNNVKMDEIEPDLDSLSYVIERSFSKPGAFHLTIVGDHNPINIGGMQATDLGVIQRSNTGKKEGN